MVLWAKQWATDEKMLLSITERETLGACLANTWFLAQPINVSMHILNE